jgi:myosin heavy subunit
VFGVAHFAGEVFYEAAQFQNKNASAHRPDIATFLRKHGGSFVRKVMNEPEQRDSSSELDRSQNNDAAVVPSKSTAPSQTQRKLFGRTLISFSVRN